ncbi:MAPEG family protein [Acidimangrovimonas sediminis]|uniref:MAPEG family protein n=1 Tax=Acidimangrovimonas sediminis TaxID=2056283 RepID=UPI000C800CCF|nr:MAPEG family protein [Acidimangrovimonas sediminis]
MALITNELNILALYGLFLALLILLQVSGAAGQLGMGYLLSSRDEGRTLDGLTGRLERAIANSVVAMALFAPAVLILSAEADFSGATLMCAQIFLIARVLYVPAYVFNIVGIRTLLWLVAFACTVALYLL